MKLQRRSFQCIFVLWLSLLAALAAADAPTVIRMGVPGVGVGNRPVTGGSSASTMHLRGMLEKEFEKDGIRVTWSFLRGAGPAVNEAYANGLLDFSLLGDLPSIIGRAGGLKTRVLAATAIRQNLYLTVPASSEIRSLNDLRGKKVSLFKGTNNQLGPPRRRVHHQPVQLEHPGGEALRPDPPHFSLRGLVRAEVPRARSGGPRPRRFLEAGERGRQDPGLTPTAAGPAS